jgi:hypothetical protein
MTSLLNRIIPTSCKEISKIIFCVSAFGLILAGFTYLLGNKAAGGECVVVRTVHGLIILLSLAAFALAEKHGKIAAILLGSCAIIYFLGGLEPLVLVPKCGDSCRDTGWKFLGLSLLGLHSIVSIPMGIYAFIAVFRIQKLEFAASARFRILKQLFSFGLSLSLVIALFFLTSFIFVKADKILDEWDQSVTVPEFSLKIILSAQAEEKLRSLGESITAAAIFDGDGESYPGIDNAPFRDVYLGRAEKEVDKNNIVEFKDVKVSAKGTKHLTDKNYYVTINVYSARKVLKNNILNCGVPEDRIQNIKGKTLDVGCSLIEEK